MEDQLLLEDLHEQTFTKGIKRIRIWITVLSSLMLFFWSMATYSSWHSCFKAFDARDMLLAYTYMSSCVFPTMMLVMVLVGILSWLWRKSLGWVFLFAKNTAAAVIIIEFSKHFEPIPLREGLLLLLFFTVDISCCWLLWRPSIRAYHGIRPAHIALGVFLIIAGCAVEQGAGKLVRLIPVSWYPL